MTESRTLPKSPKLLVVKMSSLGDHFHALPIVHSLKMDLGGTVDWVTQPEYVSLVQCFPDVDRVIAFPRRSLILGLRGFLRELRSREYDCVIDLQGLLKSAFVARMAKSDRRIGPSYSREGAHWLYTETAGPRDKERHAVEEAYDVIRHLDLEPRDATFPIEFPETKRDEAGPKVALIPCSRWPTKNWAASKFVEVARALSTEAKATIYLVGTPEDKGVCEQIAQAAYGNVVNLCGQTSLVELGSLLQEMDLVVSVDSGPMHMAAAVGVPVLAVFGATDPDRTGPYGSANQVVLTEGLECRPCFSRECARHDLACLERVTPQAVIEKALEMLQRAEP